MLYSKSFSLIIGLLTLFFTNVLSAQEHPYDYLTIVIEDQQGTAEQIIRYPESSTFEVASDDQDILQDDTAPNAYVYQGDLVLSIFPAYRKERADEFLIEEKTLRVYTTAKAAYTAGFGDESIVAPAAIKEQIDNAIQQELGYTSNNVRATKVVTASATKPGQYNLKLSFSNGIIFTYENGETRASLNGTPLSITNHYLIESKLGTAKVSFDPKDGETWWVFEERKEK